ncbi:MAG: hypothetical protein AB8H12_12250 [Lewinella sp.]
MKSVTSVSTLLLIGIFFMLTSCSDTDKAPDQKEVQKTVYPSDVTSFSEHWNLILGDGSNVGHPNDFKQEDFFYTATAADIPQQTQDLFVPIGQDGVERQNAYADEFIFFKLGAYNQTNGKSPEVNRNWCSGAETHGGDVQKQYADGNYAEVRFKAADIYVSEDAVSNKGYFTKND